MMASYILSRTLVPTMVKYLVRSEVDRYRVPEGEAGPRRQAQPVHQRCQQGGGQIASDGESNWLEGAQLLAVYVILAMVFFYLPET